jgi:hypothetical protein
LLTRAKWLVISWAILTYLFKATYSNYETYRKPVIDPSTPLPQTLYLKSISRPQQTWISRRNRIYNVLLKAIVN